MTLALVRIPITSPWTHMWLEDSDVLAVRIECRETLFFCTVRWILHQRCREARVRSWDQTPHEHGVTTLA